MSAIKNMSLFVPHVFPNFNKTYVLVAFECIGEVERVDLVAKKDRDGKPYNAAYIHFESWRNNKIARETLDDIAEYGSAKFFHDDSEYYWIVLPNTAKKHVPGERKPRLDIGDLNKTPEKSCQPVVHPVVHPGAPKKTSYASMVKSNTETIVPVKLETQFDEYVQVVRETQEAFDEYADASEEAAQMDEIEAELEAEDENLVSIDWRYVQTIEEENFWLHGEIAQLRMALINLDQMYQAEKAKVRAFSSVENNDNL